MIEDFFQIIVNLKKVQRKGWKTKLGIDYPESVADHSFNVAIMSMILGELYGLDIEKVMKMSLIHDVAESITGDFTPEEITSEEKKLGENNAMNKILATLPTDISHNYSKIWQEYSENKTAEANFVHDIDKLEMAFQAKRYHDDGHSKKMINHFLDSANKEVKDPKLREILHNILD